MGMLWVRGAGATVAIGLVVVALLLAGGTSLQIDELRVPEAIRNGSEESVILDCDYSLQENEHPTGLVVKWFFNEKDYPTPVYQWIPDQKPQVFGILKGRLNLDYRASDDKFKMHRALQITNPSPELSGDYKCTVSTFFNETSQSKRLIVYVPEKSLEVTQTKNDNAAVNVTCSAEGVYPEPVIVIQRQERPDSPEEALVQQIRNDEGLYDIYASIVLEDKVLESPTTFFCELTIPEANYTAKTSSIYMPGTSGASRSLATWLLTLLMMACLRL
ncbi:hypothetical protein R5R35_013394 [Gryllus longicercus]|uniref:Ig-like domain-containing protein n=1 Tax=Gryllus longicercus TaxID=2509291 RepID=A0AAN9W141_9ORTH